MDGWPYTDIIIINIIIIICTLEPRSRDYIKVNNYRWQSGDINGSSNNNSITARSYGDRQKYQKKPIPNGCPKPEGPCTVRSHSDSAHPIWARHYNHLSPAFRPIPIGPILFGPMVVSDFTLSIY